MLKKELFFYFSFFLFLSPNQAIQNVYNQKVTTYNLWNYNGTSDIDNDREIELRLVLNEISPDLLMVQEINNEAGYNHFLTDVLNYNGIEYEGAPFINQLNTNQDIALFYRKEEYELISNSMVHITSIMGHRNVPEFFVKHIKSGQEIYLYGVHFKAGKDKSSFDSRLSEAINLRTYLNNQNSGNHFLVMGDFNIYDGNGSVFNELIELKGNNKGRLFDPINKIGLWHNNPLYADIHTQATRVNYNGWNFGGMDDRFDLILVSETILNNSNINYIKESYIAYGNDGNHCCNDPINSDTNSLVSKELADALFYSSDHLPVILDLEFSNENVSVDSDAQPLLPFKVILGQNYPNPFNLSTVIPFSISKESQVSLIIFDLSGNVKEKLLSGKRPPGVYEINWLAENLESGIYICNLQIGNESFSKKMLFIK